ncbi:hypothetical protein [Dyadobacter luticola]|uniref:Uncharacterized protein n=1 Tax=Dyadobacter luticola TaxID=1979387 RepID=A0A5R9KS21_9BACT|nr:hypothetical protein [Dyadobacter luticola]TLU98886.1 hypothetical protein FEN17_20050 [Dyadobacter luticola]
MKLIELVQIVPEHLYAVRYEGNEQNEYDRIFDSWDDIEYLDQFFTYNADDLLTPFYDFCTIEEAVSKTLIEASKFDDRLFKAASNGQFSVEMADIFKPLVQSIKRGGKWEESKAYGPERKSWLRLYAIRTSYDVYVVTGGAIKLTRKMEDREHTRIELKKLNVVAQFLRNNGFETHDDFVYLDFK